MTHNIKAEFVGLNGSLGYKNGQEYVLTVYNGKGFEKNIQPITIYKEDGSGRCEYSHMGTFLENWDNIRKIQK